MKKLCSVVTFSLLASLANAQPPLRLKAWHRDALTRTRASGIYPSRTPGRSHWLIQYAEGPNDAQVTALLNRGIKVLSYVPEFGLSISAWDGTPFDGLGIEWAGQLEAEEKISPALAGALVGSGPVSVLVEFYADVDPNDGRAIANAAGLVISSNPDLFTYHLLVTGSASQLRALANWDEVSYIFPASSDLIAGNPVHGCAAALTSVGPVGQSVPLVGDGWDGPGLGSANVNYAFVHLTEELPASSVEPEIVRAFNEWSKYVQVTFTPTNDATADQTIAVLFASGAHGDGYPFVPDVLAHTFYPFPVNSEPIAGDMHFNDSESWKIGADVDVFSIALHETGHALGLGHSDDPNAIMYPYYHMHTALSADDISAVQQLYAAQTSPPSSIAPSSPAPVVPPILVVQTPPSSTTASSISISGAVSGGVGAVAVSWTSNQGFSGVAQGSPNWIIAAIPLNAGSNVITITAQDTAGNQASQSFTVTLQQTTAPPPITPAPPSGPPGTPDTSPPSLTILSPSNDTFATTAGSIVISGTASDNVGVTQVTWSSSVGTSGTATGTTSWSTPPIPLYVGTITIVIRAYDAAGNNSWRSVVVTEQ